MIICWGSPYNRYYLKLCNLIFKLFVFFKPRCLEQFLRFCAVALVCPVFESVEKVLLFFLHIQLVTARGTLSFASGFVLSVLDD